MAKVTIRNGPMVRTVEVEDGTTLKDFKSKVGSKLNITPQHTAQVSSEGQVSSINDDSVLTDGQEIIFQRNVGQKG